MNVSNAHNTTKKIYPNDPLCCCEYYNIDGERSHILALFCDCEIVDSICDRILKRQEIPSEKINLLKNTIEDRCRIPWFTGAIPVKPSNILPVFAVPLTILVASHGPIWTFISFITLPIVLLLFNRIFSGQRRSKMYLILGIVSILQSLFVFFTIVVSFRRLLLWEQLLFFTMLVFCLKQVISLMLSSPKPPQANNFNNVIDNKVSTESPKINCNEVYLFEQNAKDGDSSHEINAETCCKSCNKKHEMKRSGFCNICNNCVPIRDHHCVWIDKCVGENNHKLFLHCLCVCVATATYGLHLTFTTICTPRIYADWFLVPTDCRYVYSDYMFSITYVTAIYTSLFTGFLIIILLHQLTLISQNMTMREWTHARQRQLTVCHLFVRRQHNPYDMGFVANWRAFLQGNRGGDGLRNRAFSA